MKIPTLIQNVIEKNESSSQMKLHKNEFFIF